MKKVISILFSVAMVCWIGIAIYDFLRCGQKDENGNALKPLIVFNQKVYTYDDGSVTEYMSLGYKYIEYNRSSLRAYEFGPFWVDIREP